MSELIGTTYHSFVESRNPRPAAATILVFHVQLTTVSLPLQTVTLSFTCLTLSFIDGRPVYCPQGRSQVSSTCWKTATTLRAYTKITPQGPQWLFGNTHGFNNFGRGETSKLK